MPPKDNNGVQNTQSPSQQPQNAPTPTPPTPTQQVSPQTKTEPVIIHPQESALSAQIPQQNQPPNQPPPSSLYPRSTRKLIFTVVFALFFVSAITLGGALALSYNNYPAINPPKLVKDTLDNLLTISPLPKPTRLIIESAFAKSASVKSADIKTEVSIAATGDNSPINSVKLTIAGPAEFDNPSSKASEFDIGFDLKMEGASFNGNASVKTVENRVYFKVNEIPFGQLYQQLLDYKGKWFYWDIPEEYRQSADDQEISQKMTEVVRVFVEKSQSWAEVTSKEGEYYELNVKPPKEEIVNLIYELVQAAEPKDQEQLISDLEKEEISKQLEKINDLKFTMKINKDTYYIKSIASTFNLVSDQFSLPSTSESLLPTNQITLNFNINLELDNYNRNVVIVPPEDAINIEDEIKRASEDLTSDFYSPDPTQPSPEPSPLPEIPGATEEPNLTDEELHSLINPEETVLGEKYNWELELLKLFSII